MIISLVSLGTIVGLVNFNGYIDAFNNHDKMEEEEVAKGIKIIRQMEEYNVIKSEEKIDKVQDSLNKTHSNKNKEIDFRDKFSDSVILGDSRAESILGYGILDSSSVVASKGKNLITAQKKGDINKAINLAPKNIFLTYGLNDTGIYGESSKFIDEYEKIIKYIQKKLPTTKIYVNSIFGVENVALVKEPYLKKISEFNEALSEMCDRLDLTYVDGSSIVDSSLYEGDGVHFKPEFNKLWLKLLIQDADL